MSKQPTAIHVKHFTCEVIVTHPISIPLGELHSKFFQVWCKKFWKLDIQCAVQFATYISGGQQ